MDHGDAVKPRREKQADRSRRVTLRMMILSGEDDSLETLEKYGEALRSLLAEVEEEFDAISSAVMESVKSKDTSYRMERHLVSQRHQLGKAEKRLESVHVRIRDNDRRILEARFTATLDGQSTMSEGAL
jgi:hypothetical protein